MKFLHDHHKTQLSSSSADLFEAPLSLATNSGTKYDWNCACGTVIQRAIVTKALVSCKNDRDVEEFGRLGVQFLEGPFTVRLEKWVVEANIRHDAIAS
ncbi:hypothetical protein U1Q18_030561 [Sarracenia purpurea var. burkii]